MIILFYLVHFLVSKGANPNTVNQKGDSPLIQAVFVNRYDIVLGGDKFKILVKNIIQLKNKIFYKII